MSVLYPTVADSEMFGVAQSCLEFLGAARCTLAGTYSYLLGAPLLLSVAPPTAYRALLRFAWRKGT